MVETGLPGKPKKSTAVASSRASLTPASRDSSEHDWPSRLDERSGEEKFSLEFGQDLFYQIVLPHRNSACEQQQIGFKSVSDQFPQARWLIGSNRQQDRISARGLHLRRQRIAVRIADLGGPG